MEYNPGQKPVRDVVTQPRQMAGIIFGRCGGGFDLNTDDVAGIEFGDDVNLVASVVLAEVVQTAAALAHSGLSPQLGDDEGFQQTSEQVRVAHDGLLGGPDCGGQKRRIDE